ncbi:alpha-amylase family glycosyl hydrolase [Cohnella cellulosilytica]|uniref:Alpha-amylase family glycosyl hydrolase n=1 Tax=Cohnella cellulosilytica TaxID=986710 RepID=A0ABW2FSS7_9BACL
MNARETSGVRTFGRGNVVLSFAAASGRLLSIQNGPKQAWTGTVAIDIGCDGQYRTGRLEYRSFEGANTWDLPRIVPGADPEKAWDFDGFEETDGALEARYRMGELALTVRYRIDGGTVAIEAEFVSDAPRKLHVNGVAFMLSQPLGGEPVAFDFPGNVPYPVFQAGGLPEREAVETGLVNPVVRLVSGADRTNVIFVDEEEKWGTGVYRSGSELHLVNLAAVEAELEPGKPLVCGTLYIQANAGGEAEAYAAIRELYVGKGWTPPTDGHRDGVLYSCHPHGTMDSGFPLRRDMAEYAWELDGLRKMGIDHVWVLPIFEHLDRGVYHPTDQRIVDERYGGDEAVRSFSRRIRELGMTLLFDYVPHGPEPEDPLGLAHREWASLRRDGELQSEWNCLSFDMTHPDYLQYTKDLVREHVARFDVDGARIDCAMGGLTNWRPYGDHRPSNSNLKGGILISKAIRDGFAESGKKPLVTPENFNPVPAYAPVTDVFYDMALYRALYDMENAGLTPERFARELTRWLEAELLSTVQGDVKLRFLGNHDTVTWVWNKARATAWYGVERAKALWVLLSCIDGMPMLYQGDEDASIYGGEGPDLRSFFRELFAMRRRYLGNDYATDYVYTGTSVVAFYRRGEGGDRLVAVNLSGDPAAFAEAGADLSRGARLVYGEAETSADGASLQGYGWAVWTL